MDLEIRNNEKIRIKGNWKAEHFIDIEPIFYNEALAINLYPTMQYIEIRKTEEGFCRMFLFLNKRQKKDYDFGFYKDAEVIFSLNNVRHKK